MKFNCKGDGLEKEKNEVNQEFWIFIRDINIFFYYYLRIKFKIKTGRIK